MLVDPVNGQADLTNRELRTANSYAFFDDPNRLFRLLRLQHVLGFTLAPRTQSQLENALLEDYVAASSATALACEIRAAALDPNAVAFIEGLSSQGLLKPLSAALAGPKLNTAGMAKFEKLVHETMPPGEAGGWLAFLSVFVEKLNQRERAEVVKAFEMSADETARWKRLEAEAAKLESGLKSSRIHKPSQVWDVLHKASADEILLVLYRSGVRVVHDRIRAYYEKYMPLAMEITDEVVVESGAKLGTPKFVKVKLAMITTRLNARPRKVEVVEPELAPVAVSGGARGRG